MIPNPTINRTDAGWHWKIETNDAVYDGVCATREEAEAEGLRVAVEAWEAMPKIPEWIARAALRSAHEECTAAEIERNALSAALDAERIKHNALSAQLGAERCAVVSALRAWAEDGGDPWMSHCADRIAAGEHVTRQKAT
jgi:hypothetical protein